MPHIAISVVANWNECDIGARIIDPPNATCDNPHAVVISGWYGFNLLAKLASRFGTALVETDSSSSEVSVEGEETTKGRMTDPAKEMMEKRTRAMEPRRAMSPTTSGDDCSSAAREAEAR